MAKIGRKNVMILVDANFFDNIFEKERKKLERKLQTDLGLKKGLSQPNFTKILANNNAQIKMPNFKFSLNNDKIKKKKR